MACNLDHYAETSPGRFRLDPEAQWSELLESVMRVRMRPLCGEAQSIAPADRVWRLIGDRDAIFQQWSRVNFPVCLCLCTCMQFHAFWLRSPDYFGGGMG